MTRSSKGTLFGLLLLAVVLVPGLHGAAQAPAKETLAGAPEYTRVSHDIATGGVIEFSAFPELKRRGFKSVVNLRLATEPDAKVEEEGAAARAAGLNYIHLPLRTGGPEAAKTVEDFLKAILDPANLPVYIHSRAAHRVGGMWIIKRVIVDGWTTDKALAEVETSIGLNDSAKDFALNYIKTHPKSR